MHAQTYKTSENQLQIAQIDVYACFVLLFFALCCLFFYTFVCVSLSLWISVVLVLIFRLLSLFRFRLWSCWQIECHRRFYDHVCVCTVWCVFVYDSVCLWIVCFWIMHVFECIVCISINSTTLFFHSSAIGFFFERHNLFKFLKIASFFSSNN